MPTQMPRTGRPASTRLAITFSPPMPRSPAMQAANAPTPGTTRPSHSAAASQVGGHRDVGAGRASARSAERRFPDP